MTDVNLDKQIEYMDGEVDWFEGVAKRMDLAENESLVRYKAILASLKRLRELEAREGRLNNPQSG